MDAPSSFCVDAMVLGSEGFSINQRQLDQGSWSSLIATDVPNILCPVQRYMQFVMMSSFNSTE